MEICTPQEASQIVRRCAPRHVQPGLTTQLGLGSVHHKPIYDTAQILERNTLSADRKFTKWAQQGRPSISHTTLPLWPVGVSII